MISSQHHHQVDQVHITDTMLAHADAWPLLLGDPKSMLVKLTDATGTLARLWQTFEQKIQDDSQAHENVLAFYATLTGNHVAPAKQRLLNQCTLLQKSDLDLAVQLHTWCVCGTQLRNVLFTDWLHWREPFTKQQLEHIAQTHLGLAWKHAYPTLLSRVPSADNQNIAMTLYCTIVGYLFGHKLTRYATGHFLFSYGIQRLPRLLGLFPCDGYSGEGSTYTSHVNTPLFCWLDQLFKTFDMPVNHAGFEPNGTTFENLIDMERKLIGPTGQLLPWDHYGWSAQTNGSVLAYLAGLVDSDQQQSLLTMINDLGIGTTPGMMAWGNDNPMWTLIWWPEQHKHWSPTSQTPPRQGWCLPQTAAALEDPQRQTRLVQAWDICAESFTAIGRMQVNPNHLMLEVHGEPVFQDGVPLDKSQPFDFDIHQAMSTLTDDARRRLISYASLGRDCTVEQFVKEQFAGMLGAANAIVIDDQDAYWPGRAVNGQATCYGFDDYLQLACASAIDFYKPAFDVTTAKRMSIWSRRWGLGLIIDDLAAQSSHRWRWQVYLRPDTKQTGNRQLQVFLPKHHLVSLAWDQDYHQSIQHVPGYPRTHELSSDRLSLETDGTQASFAVALGVDVTNLAVQSHGVQCWDIQSDGQCHRIELDMVAAVCRWIGPDGHVDELPITIPTPRDQDCHGIQQWDMDDRLAALPAFESNDALSSRLTTWFAETEYCMYEAVLASNDRKLESRLSIAMASDQWPVVCAAAEWIGRKQLTRFAKLVRDRLDVEERIPVSQLYAQNNSGEMVGDACSWRLKVALIAALGRLSDAPAAGMIQRILDRSVDFYTVQSVAAQALHRIGDKQTLKTLYQASLDPEVNTSLRAAYAVENFEIVL